MKSGAALNVSESGSSHRSEVRYSTRYEHLARNGGQGSEGFRFLAGPLPADDLTHSMYPYPARLVRHVPRFLLRSEGFVGPDLPIVIDPFCGSGTVLVEAQAAGLDALGLDTNPVAALVSRVKTTRMATAPFLSVAAEIVDRAKRTRTPRTSNHRLSRWHSAEALSALTRLSAGIAGMAAGTHKDAMQVAFGLTVRACSRMDPRIPVPVVAKDGRGTSLSSRTVWQTFSVMAERVSIKIGRLVAGAAEVTVKNEDARNESAYEIPAERVAVLLSSPPYGAAQKYARSTSLEATWLGLIKESGPAEVERSTVGREHISAADRSPSTEALEEWPELGAALRELRTRDPARADIYAHYFLDMNSAIRAVATAVPSLQKVALVAGTNIVSGSTVDTHKFLEGMFHAVGFSTQFVVEDEIRGRTLLTNRARGSDPARSEFIYVMER